MPRPATRFLCRWVPRRTVNRAFTVNDAARVCCYTIKDGHSVKEILAAIELKCDAKTGDAERGVSEAAISSMVGEFEANNAAWDTVLDRIRKINTALFAMGAILTVVGLIANLNPVAKLSVVAASRAVRNVVTRVEGFEGTIIARKASNDKLIEILKGWDRDGLVLRKAA